MRKQERRGNRKRERMMGKREMLVFMTVKNLTGSVIQSKMYGRII